MTEEFKGRGLTPCHHPCGGYIEDHTDVGQMLANIPVDPELKARLDASLVNVRGAETGRTSAAEPRSGAIPKIGRGRTRTFTSYDACGFLHAGAVDEYGYPIGNSREDHAERERSYDAKVLHTAPREDFEITAKVEITEDDLNPTGVMGKMVRNGAKQIMAQELNRAYAEAGIKSRFTSEMLSAIASEQLRAEQKRKKKARINKRNRK